MELSEISNLLNSAKQHIATNNYYFQTHNCQKTNSELKIYLDYIIKHENSERIIKFGMCPHCNILFYNKTFESNNTI